MLSAFNDWVKLIIDIFSKKTYACVVFCFLRLSLDMFINQQLVSVQVTASVAAIGSVGLKKQKQVSTSKRRLRIHLV